MQEIPGTHSRVLVIEDDLGFQRLMECYLQRCGVTVDLAADGKSGMEKALAGDYDIAFVDIQLPQLDGFMVATLLREQDCQLPLIAMTSLTLEGLGHKASAVGFDAFMEKSQAEECTRRLLHQYLPITP